jgi:hypothetical protein
MIIRSADSGSGVLPSLESDKANNNNVIERRELKTHSPCQQDVSFSPEDGVYLRSARCGLPGVVTSCIGVT